MQRKIVVRYLVVGHRFHKQRAFDIFLLELVSSPYFSYLHALDSDGKLMIDSPTKILQVQQMGAKWKSLICFAYS